VEINSVVTRNLKKSEDELIVGVEYDERQPYLEESEDSEDKKLLMLFECEDAIPVWWDSEGTLLTWNESEVGPLPLCHDI
jgi:hypothetical protein